MPSVSIASALPLQELHELPLETLLRIKAKSPVARSPHLIDLPLERLLTIRVVDSSQFSHQKTRVIKTLHDGNKTR